MSLFGFGKKNEDAENKGCCCGGAPVEEVKSEPACACNGDAVAYEAGSSCCCGGDSSQTENCCCKNELKSIRILGAGCKSCHDQYQYVIDAVAELGIATDVQYITDMEVVMGYGVMSMPAIVVNEEVVAYGKVLKSAEVIKLLEKLGF